MPLTPIMYNEFLMLFSVAKNINYFSLDPRLDFSFNETSLEPECTTNANDNVSKYDNVTNYHSENERNEKSISNRTSTAVVTSNCLDSKQLTSSASSSHPATTSSTEPSVVRNIIERGSQLKEQENFTEVY